MLTGIGLLTVLIEVPGLTYPWAAAGVALLFAVVAVLGYAWVDRQEPRRRRALAAGYVVVQLVLGYLIFGLGEAGIGPTLLLMVLISQSVLLLPLPAAAVVTALVPFVHLGTGWVDLVRNGLGLLGAAVFTAVVTELLHREQRARADLAAAHGRLREYAAQAEELATIQERNRLARDIHDGLGHHLTVVQMQIQAARAVLGADPERTDVVLAQAQQPATARPWARDSRS